jgi:hypothetical protein
MAFPLSQILRERVGASTGFVDHVDHVDLTTATLRARRVVAKSTGGAAMWV